MEQRKLRSAAAAIASVSVAVSLGTPSTTAVAPDAAVLSRHPQVVSNRGGLVGVSSRSDPAFGGVVVQNGPIAFTRPGARGGMRVMNADGRGVRGLLGHPRVHDGAGPAYSADGRRIVFARRPGDEGGQITIVDADGTRPHVVIRSPTGMDPSFSPDGRTIVFASWTGGREGIHTVRVNGTGLRRLTNHRSDANPTFSPDGHAIAFVRVRDVEAGVQGCRLSGIRYGVYFMDITGGHQHRVSRTCEDLCCPQFSRTGETIVVSFWEWTSEGSPGVGDIATMSTSSGHTRRVTHGPRDDDSPTFSPDGRWIAFARSDKLNRYGIYVMPASGGRPQRLERPGVEPSWGVATGEG